MPMTTENDPARSLEDVWRDILQRHGVSEAQAEDIVKLTFGTPALTRDIPDIDDVPDIVADSLAETDFEEYLDDNADSDGVQRQLIQALKDALRGTLSGPASVSDATLAQAFDDVTTGPGENSVSASSSPGVAHPDTGAAWKSAGVDRAAESDLNEDDIDVLADALEGLMKQHDLDDADLYAALERLKERRTE